MSSSNQDSFRALIRMIETLMSPPAQRVPKFVGDAGRKPIGPVRTDVVDVVKRQKRIDRVYDE